MAEDFLASALEAEAGSRARQDPDYPLFHVAPPVGRLNDPNGLIEVGGTYHAFFQYTPQHPRKLVYWGHATSADLTHWDYHAPAILPDTRQDRNGAYSGTAIEVGDHVELWYTGNYKDAETGEREATQCVVTTRDMVHFDKHVPPIIESQPRGYTAHFRDPQVWRDTDGSYRMLLGVQRENLTGAALLYRSTDLRAWECEGEMTFPDASGAFDSFGYMWECPNLVRLRDEESGCSRDVLIFCPQGITPEREGFENVFPCVAIVGELVGTEFRGADGCFEEVDRGTEFYAPQIMARSSSSPSDAARPQPALWPTHRPPLPSRPSPRPGAAARDPHGRGRGGSRAAGGFSLVAPGLRCGLRSGAAVAAHRRGLRAGDHPGGRTPRRRSARDALPPRWPPCRLPDGGGGQPRRGRPRPLHHGDLPG